MVSLVNSFNLLDINSFFFLHQQLTLLKTKASLLSRPPQNLNPLNLQKPTPRPTASVHPPPQFAQLASPEEIEDFNRLIGVRPPPSPTPHPVGGLILKEVGSTSETFGIFMVSRSYVFSSDARILDVSDPQNIKAIDSLRESVFSKYLSDPDIEVYAYKDGKKATLNDVTDASTIFDVVDTSGTKHVEFELTDVKENLAFISVGEAVENGEGDPRFYVSIYDVTDPYKPRELSRIEGLEGLVALPGNSLLLEARADITSSSPLGFGSPFHPTRLVDASVPTNPQIVTGTSAFQEATPHPGSHQTVEFKGNLMFMGTGGGTILAFDLSDPTNPRLLSKLQTSAGGITDIYFSGSYAYLTDGTRNVTILDVSDPGNLRELKRFDTGTPGSVAGSGTSITGKGNLLFVAMDDLRVYDISDPLNPRFLLYRDHSELAAGQVEADDRFLYVSGGTAQQGFFHIYEIGGTGDEDQQDDNLSLFSFRFEPETLQLGSEGDFITAFLRPKDGFRLEDINLDSLTLRTPLGGTLKPASTLLEGGQLQLKFPRKPLEELLKGLLGPVQLELRGSLTGGLFGDFRAFDTIQVIAPPLSVFV